MKTPTKYISTVTVYSPLCFEGMKPGQWFKWAGASGNGSRGQYMGTTRAGVDAVRYQQGNFGKKADTMRNHLMRKWAKQNGSK